MEQRGAHVQILYCTVVSSGQVCVLRTGERVGDVVDVKPVKQPTRGEVHERVEEPMRSAAHGYRWPVLDEMAWPPART